MKKKINYNKIISIVITIIFVGMTFFVFPNSIGRIIESLRDLFVSIAFYFKELFMIDGEFKVTVTELPKIPFFDFWGKYKVPTTSLPERLEQFREQWGIYWQRFISKENVVGYVNVLMNGMYRFCKFLLLFMPFVFALIIYLRRILSKQNNDYNKDSKALKIYKKFVLKVILPFKNAINSFIKYEQEHKFKIVWLLIWLLNFNIFTIILEFIAFYLYFIFSFDISNVYMQVYKLALDLWAIIDFVPFVIWVIVGLICIDKIRRKMAYKTLIHYELRNRGFINERPIVTLFCGSMGKKKTTIATDFALSTEVIHRDKAFERILENDLKFPYFPWINLEKEIKQAMKNHDVYNLATCEEFIKDKFFLFQENECQENIFGYDYERYGRTYDDKLKLVDIWEVLETYTKLYFIYVINSALLITNYSIRSDILMQDIGNFPLWNTDFFKRDSRLIDSFSRHSKILDQDCLRYGKTIIENNVYKDSFEFGIIVITEIGKERGNNLELLETKKKSLSANQKNDLFNYALKMIRHSATVDNYPFVKVITDEQRASSWGADARELSDVVTIVENTDNKLAMPLFFIEELLHDLIFSRFKNVYRDYRYNRGDNTLLVYLLKSLVSFFHRYYVGIYSQYGYSVSKLKVEDGKQDGSFKNSKYYLMNKKIYSKRFSTDCFSDFFMKKSLKSIVGLADLPEYATEKASFEELAKQNSYFMNDLLKGFGDIQDM